MGAIAAGFLQGGEDQIALDICDRSSDEMFGTVLRVESLHVIFPL